MYIVEFYSNADGDSELLQFMEELRERSKTSKDARIQYRQIILYIQLLEDHGSSLPDNISKHLEEDIWELRPGHNRILYFFYHNNKYVLLHSFRKKTQKTPRREIEKAKRERAEWLSREEE